MEYVFAGIIIYLCGVTTGYLLPRRPVEFKPAVTTEAPPFIAETPCNPPITATMVYDPITRKPRKI